LRPLERGKRARGRSDAGALGEQRPRQAPLARPFGRRDQRQVDDVALGVAAADPDRLVANRQDRFDRLGIIAVGEGERAVDEAPADLGRHLPIVAGAQAFIVIQGSA